MKVSIIVPIFNSEEYLDKCIGSIINQSYNNIEIILVNDCSTDTSLEICKRYEALDDRVIIINQTENQGQVSAYKKGVEVATGVSIGFVDSDDWISVEMFEKMVKQMRIQQADIVVCGVQKVYEDRIVNEPFNSSDYKDIYTKEELVLYSNDMFAPGNPITEIIKFYRCNKLIRKDILLKNMEYVDASVRVFEDNCLVLPCILDASKIYFVKEHLYFYYQRPDSTMHKFNIDVIETNRKVVKTIGEIYKDRKIDHNINLEIVMCSLYSLNMILKSNLKKESKIKWLKEVQKDLKNVKGILGMHYNYKIKISLLLLINGMFEAILQLYNLYNSVKK